MLVSTRPYEPLLDAFLGDAVGDAAIDRRVAAADPLLSYLDRLHHGYRARALVDYFRGGWSAHRLIRQSLRLRFGARTATASILDFGSGYGRTTRFLVREHPVEKIAVADVMADAIELQRELYGVRGFVSTPEPDRLPGDWPGVARGGGGETFDLVVAMSVFTHLHPDDFSAWLERLRALVAPGGMLLFTVNDASTLLPGRALDASGVWFEPASENDRLDPRRYGSTWVSEAFVACALAAGARRAADVEPSGDAAYRRVRRGVWASQDVYLVPVGGGALPDPPPIALEPAGRLEAAAWSETGAITLSGWAAMPDGAPVATVSASLDGRQVATVSPDAARPDVARELGSRDGAAYGWRLAFDPPRGGLGLNEILRIDATSADGVGFVLELDTLGETLLFVRTVELRDRIARLEHEVRRRDLELGRQKERMGALWWGARNRHFELKALRRELELSRFWKLRNRWWAAKRRLRLGAKPPQSPDA